MLTLKQFTGSLVTPTDDALFYDFLLSGQCGIFEGCEVTHLGANQLRVSSGRGVILGRIFTVEEETIQAAVSPGGEVDGRLLIRVDMSNEEKPIEFVTQAETPLPELTQEDINRDGSVYELPLAVYKVTELLISGLERAAEPVQTPIDDSVRQAVQELQAGKFNAAAQRSGTTVAITGPAEAQTITFPAPADWTAGDSYTYNGQPLTLTDLNREPVEDAWKAGSPVTFYLSGGSAFFKAGGMGKLPSDLAPLCPSFKVERNGGKIKVSADKIQLNPYTNMVQGGVWAWGKTRPVKPTGTNLKQWTRADLLTTGKPYDGLYLGDVTPSDAVKKAVLWLPENQDGRIRLIPFLVLSTDYLGGVYVMREYLWQLTQWNTSLSKIPYSQAYIKTLLESTYLSSVLDASVASQVMEVDLPISQNTSNPADVTTVKAKAFPPSITEIGQADVNASVEGTAMQYFNSPTRRTLKSEDGKITQYWTRTPATNTSGNVYYINPGGSPATFQMTDASIGAPVAMVLPKDMKIQQRPDGSYTIWDENGLQTLADVEPSGEVSAVYANITEGGKIVPTIFLNKEYSGTEGALLLRNDIYTNAAMSSATYQNSGADNTCTTWATTVVDEPYRAKMLDVEVKYYDVTKASVQTVPSKRKAFILGSQGLNVPGADTWPKYETTSPYFASDNRRKAPSGNVYWNRDKYSGNDAFSAYYYVSSTGSAGYENGANSRGIRPACVLRLDTAVRALADGTFDIVPADPGLSAQGVSTMAAAGTPVQLKDIPVSDESIKTVLKLIDNGEEKDFLYLVADYNSSGRGLLLRDEVLDEFMAYNTTAYESSNVFNKCLEWADGLDSVVRKFLEPVDLQYRFIAYNGAGSTQIKDTRAVAFVLGALEYNDALSGWPGKHIPYFSGNARRIATDSSGSPKDYWTKDCQSTYNGVATTGYIRTDGIYSAGIYNSPNVYIRPAITLPPEAWFIDNVDGTYTFVGDEPTPDLSIEIDWPEGDPLVARQWVYNDKGQYQTMLLGGVASTEDVPEPDPVFGNNTPEQIKEAIRQGVYKDLWSIGDETTIFAGDAEYTFQIAGFDHDQVTDGGKTAPITLIMTQLMNNYRVMNTGETNVGSFVGSEMFQYLNETVLESMPADWRSIIAPVDKKTSAGGSSTVIQTDSMKAFLLSEEEVFGTAKNSVAGQGSQYAIFATSTDRVKRMANGSGVPSFWWLRSPRAGNNIAFCAVNSSGAINAATSNYGACGVCFGLCIG